MYLTQSLWRDEAFSYLMATLPISQIWRLMALDTSPPLYYFVLKVWMWIFGTSEMGMRSMSITFGLLAGGVTLLFARDVLKFDRTKLLLSVVTMLSSSALIAYTFEARNYTMFAFLAIASMVCYSKGNLKWWLVWCGLGIYTHYFMWVVVVGQLGHALWYRNKQFLINLGLLVGMYLPWMWTVWAGQQVREGYWIGKPAVWKLPVIFGQLLGTTENDHTFPLVWGVTVVTVSVALGWGIIKWTGRVKLDKAHKLLMIWALGLPILVYVVSWVSPTPLFLARYMIFATFGLVIVVVQVLDKRLVGVVCAILLVYHAFAWSGRRKEDMPAVLAKLPTGSQVLVEDVLDIHTVQYYWGREKVFVYRAKYEQIPWYVGKALITPEMLDWKLYPNTYLLTKNRELVKM